MVGRGVAAAALPAASAAAAGKDPTGTCCCSSTPAAAGAGGGGAALASAAEPSACRANMDLKNSDSKLAPARHEGTSASGRSLASGVLLRSAQQQQSAALEARVPLALPVRQIAAAGRCPKDGGRGSGTCGFVHGYTCREVQEQGGCCFACICVGGVKCRHCRCCSVVPVCAHAGGRFVIIIVVVVTTGMQARAPECYNNDSNNKVHVTLCIASP